MPQNNGNNVVNAPGFAAFLPFPPGKRRCGLCMASESAKMPAIDD
ncbi:hypothetical protein [Kalamiella sp. sgz302252]